jgi:hypothetical protein
MNLSSSRLMRTHPRRVASLLTLLLGLASVLLSAPGHARSRRARSSESTPRLATKMGPGRYVMAGINLGLTSPAGTPAEPVSSEEVWHAIGFELSAVKVPGKDLLWAGGYFDLVQVLPNRATRLTIGPEVGWGPLGLDAGLLAEYSGRTGKFNGGFQIRGLLTVGVLAAYMAAPCLYDADALGFRPQVQIGLLLKVPVLMKE